MVGLKNVLCRMFNTNEREWNAYATLFRQPIDARLV